MRVEVGGTWGSSGLKFTRASPLHGPVAGGAAAAPWHPPNSAVAFIQSGRNGLGNTVSAAVPFWGFA